ncbi:MAG: hypothetical protein ACRCXX_11785 [Cetobacterium sp.]|uniref:hypothetical protein n=1 Tax=Cetobacterium sp. TaxID=2071632 RepID=UPI003F318204
MLSIQKLLEIKKSERGAKEDVVETLLLKEFGDNVKVRIPSPTEIQDYIKGNADDDMENIIYNCMIEPKLSSNELITAYACENTPFKVVSHVFARETILHLGNYIIEGSNAMLESFTVQKVVDIKN